MGGTGTGDREEWADDGTEIVVSAFSFAGVFMQIALGLLSCAKSPLAMTIGGAWS